MLTKSTTENLISIFKSINLSEDHAKLYIANLDLGPSGASQIAQHAGINRTTAYDKLEDLISIALISKTKNYNKHIYTASEIDRIETIIKDYSSKLTESLNLLQESTDELTIAHISNLENAPKVRYYTDSDGLKTVLYDSLTADMLYTVCYGNSNIQAGLDSDPEYLIDFINEATDMKLPSKEILMDTPSVREYFETVKDNGYTEVIIIPSDDSEKTGHVDKHIYSNKIAYISHDNLIGVIIEDQTLYNTEKHQFDKLWRYYLERAQKDKQIISNIN